MTEGILYRCEDCGMQARQAEDDEQFPYGYAAPIGECEGVCNMMPVDEESDEIVSGTIPSED